MKTASPNFGKLLTLLSGGGESAGTAAGAELLRPESFRQSREIVAQLYFGQVSQLLHIHIVPDRALHHPPSRHALPLLAENAGRKTFL
jgi:hypothetical protein